MKRNAFLMQLKAGCEKEYRRRHDRIWPELKRELRAAGVSDYTIYLDRKTGTLFAFQKLADDHTSGELPNSPVIRKWWEAMSSLMETNPDQSPQCVQLSEVFHLD